MRIHLKLSPATEPVPFNHLPALVGVLHKWLGWNKVHDSLSLYSFSWLQAGRAEKDGLIFPNGANWFISAHDAAFIAKIKQGVNEDSEIRWGIRVINTHTELSPDFSGRNEVRFLLASPVFIKRSLGIKNDKQYLYTDPESNALLTESLQRKFAAAGLNPDGVSVRFDTAYAKAKVQMQEYRGVKNKCSYCPVFVKESPEQLAFAWNVGIGNSTGSGFGSVH